MKAISFLGERLAVYQGKRKKFYLFKLTLSDGDEAGDSYLGVAGPYELSSKELLPFSDAGGLYWDESFNKSKMEKQFKAYLDQFSASGE